MAFRTTEEIRSILRPRKEGKETFGGDYSDEEDYVEDQETTDTEQECDEETSEEDSEDGRECDLEETATVGRGRRRSFIYGINKHKWCVKPSETRGRRCSVVIPLPGPQNDAVNASSPLNMWSVLFTYEMIDMIVQHTNQEIERQKGSATEQAYNKETTVTEIKAFIGLLYFSGVNKSGHVNIEELWSTEYGYTLFNAVMSARRFQFIAARLRFDDKNTRAERRENDLLAAIRDLWEKFINNCTTNYTPSQEMTIDEQLLGFRGRFAAKVYIKSKPARYGIKIMCLNDAKTHYLYNAMPYSGRVNTLAGESVPSFYIRTLCLPIYGSNRNVTCDNWFTSVEIFDTMLQKHSLTMVGTIRKNKRHIPASYKRPVSAGTVCYAYDNTKTLLSYCPKRNKVVLLLSSLHKCGKTNEHSGKPEIIEYYNRTKGGTDCFDQLCSLYSCARRTKRWPMRFFMGIVDQAGVNSSILYNFIPTNNIKHRREFLKELALALVMPYLEERAQLPGLHKDIRSSIYKILGRSDIADNKTDKLQKRKRLPIVQQKPIVRLHIAAMSAGKPSARSTDA